MIFLKMMWGRIWPYFAALGAALAAVLAIRQSGKAAGRAEVERDRADAIIKRQGKLNEADTKVAQMDDGAIRDRLAKWVRPVDTEDH